MKLFSFNFPAAASDRFNDALKIFFGHLGGTHGSGYKLFVICFSLFLARQIINVTVQKWKGFGNQLSAFQVFTAIDETLIFRRDELVYEFTKGTPTMSAKLDVLLIMKPTNPFFTLLNKI